MSRMATLALLAVGTTLAATLLAQQKPSKQKADAPKSDIKEAKITRRTAPPAFS